MQRMTDVLSRMLNDPMTRAALSAGGEDSLDQESQRQDDTRESGENPNPTVEESAAAASPAPSVSTNPEQQQQNENAASENMIVNEPNQEMQAENCSSASTEYSSPITNHLRSHLSTLRNLRYGFIEQHGSEPSVSLRYSQQSTSNSTISLRVGDEIDRANFIADNEESAVPSTSSGDGASESQNRNESVCISLL